MLKKPPPEQKEQNQNFVTKILRGLLHGVIKLILTLTLCWYAIGVDFSVNFSREKSKERTSTIGKKVISTLKFAKNVYKELK